MNSNLESSITHVSDTALWVATFRASESARADPAFDDPLAALLAGERGRRIARAFSRTAMTEWAMVVRTSAIDRLIYDALSTGVDTVLNLGAGMDARPYRMKLPEDLRWIEVDFPTIIESKNSKLVERRPPCRLERIGMDLLDRRSRRELLSRNDAMSRSTLVLTEGVIPYLSAYDVSTLANDLHASAAADRWIQDFDNAGRRSLPRGWERRLQAAPLLFDAKDWFRFFTTYGWDNAGIITSFEESVRINRPYPVDFPYGLLMKMIPHEMRKNILGLSGVVLMQKRHSPPATRLRTPAGSFARE